MDTSAIKTHVVLFPDPTLLRVGSRNETIIGFNRGCGLQETESASLDQTRSEWANIEKQRSGQTEI